MEKTCNIIELNNVNYSIDNKLILNNLTIHIEDGSFVTILGPSGCGKSTTLKLIAGFLFPISGNILFKGKIINHLPPYKRNINTVFQNYALFPHLNVFDNIAFGLRIKKTSKSLISDLVHRMLEVVNLKGFEKRYPANLSGGQQQRVALARALVNEPDVLLLDEPLSAVDSSLKADMQFELKEMQQQLKTTFIYVTHDQEEALALSDTVIVLNDGIVQQMGPPESIYNEPTNAFVAEFIGQSNILNGIMIEDFKVSFAGGSFECVDKDFKPNQPVDVVIRPEDIKIVDKNLAKFSGIVSSIMFKGALFELEVLAGNIYWLVHTTQFYEKGSQVGLNFNPDDVHIMNKLFEETTNKIPATVVDQNTIKFLNVSFHRENLNIKPGSKITITISPDNIFITSIEDADIALTLDFIIYKGAYNEMYFYYKDENTKNKYFHVNSEVDEEVGTLLGLKFNFNSIKLNLNEPS